MIYFWATTAIIAAIWASAGEVDGGSLVLVLIVMICLYRLWLAEKAICELEAREDDEGELYP